MHQMTLELIDGVHVVHVRIPDLIDLLQIEELSQGLTLVVESESPKSLVVHFVDTVAMSSSVLGILVNTWKRLKVRGGNGRVCGIPGHMSDVLRHTKLDRVLTPSRSVHDAVSELKSHGEQESQSGL